MDIINELYSLGPLVAVVLAALLLSKELLVRSGRSSSRLNWTFNMLIIPLLIVFAIGIILHP